MSKTFTMGGEEYDVIDSRSVAASKALADMFKRLGEPDDPFSPAGEQMMKLMIAAWEDLWPDQVPNHRGRIKDYRETELSTSQQSKRETGRQLASIPSPIYAMMRKVFPNYKMDTREDFMKLCRKYPIFQLPENL